MYNAALRRMRRALSPFSLLMLCWGLSGLVTAVTLSRLEDLDLVSTFMMREHLDLSAFGVAGLMWLLLALLVYGVADLAANTTRRRLHNPPPPVNLPHLARLTFVLNLLLLGVTAIWVLTAAAKAGGLMQLAAAAYVDSLSTRDLLLENKLFTGMRLFYAALPATACLAAALLATGALPRRARRLMLATLICNTVALFILPIVMSQRLLLLQLLLSAYIVSCMIKGRLFGLKWVMLAAGLFFGLWVAREAITNPLIDRSALDIGTQKLAFYVVNDMWNAFAPLEGSIPHTYGGLTLEGLMFLTLTDGHFATLLAPKMHALDAVIGGGEFPFLTAAFVDYGSIGGALFIAFTAFVIRLVYVKSARSIGWAAAYAQIGAALLFSSHSVYFTHQNFLFSLMLIAGLMRLVHGRSRSDVRTQGPAACAALPDNLMHQMALFSTQRSTPPTPLFHHQRQRYEPAET